MSSPISSYVESRVQLMFLQLENNNLHEANTIDLEGFSGIIDLYIDESTCKGLTDSEGEDDNDHIRNNELQV